ncbi:MAG: HDOD domain-containing protein [candidate division Zixibacteria bacterium]|nr:HDOD domain-containing protein [candidate division Zixibacteria bacterium]
MSVCVKNDPRTVDQILQRLGDLPSAPPLLDKALRLTMDVDSHIPEIVRIVAADQSISAKVVRVSNSPMYARASRVSTLDEAVAVLGFNQLKSIIITASTFQIFQTTAHAEIATKLWHHSYSSAIGAGIIAERLTSLNKDQAYLGGLLHDIGKLAFLKTAPQAYTQLVEKVKRDNTGLLAEEQREFGFDHADLGAALLEKWAVPDEISNAVKSHHTCLLGEAPATEELARVIAVADSVSQYIGAAFYEPYRVGIEEQYYLGPVPIDGEHLIMIRCDTESEFHYQLGLLYG